MADLATAEAPDDHRDDVTGREHIEEPSKHQHQCSPCPFQCKNRTRDASLPYWLWIAIAVDVLGIGVYQAKGLYVTAGLYAVFLVLATCGLIAWARTVNVERTRDLAAT